MFRIVKKKIYFMYYLGLSSVMKTAAVEALSL